MDTRRSLLTRLRSRFRSPLGVRKTLRKPKSALRSATYAGPLPRNPFTLAFWKARKARGYFRITWKRFFVTAGILIAVILISFTAIFAYFVRDLPNPTQLTNRPVHQATQILDRNSTNLYNIYGEQNRALVSSDQISPFVKEATISVEDATFYTNRGVDLRGLLRVVRNKLFHVGVQGSGGSTITQQYIKNALLQDTSKTTSRKLREIILALEVGRIYTKDQILAGYLNDIPYGTNAYGIQAAAQTYYGKDAKDLTLSEAATLAAIPQAPSRYSPYGNHLDLLFGRKNYILDRMVKLGYISQKDADDAKIAAPNADQPNFRTQGNLLAPHFVFYVRELLAAELSNDPQTAEQKLDEAGYKVFTSLDLPTQQQAEQVLNDLGPNTIKKYHASNAAIVEVDPKSGEVRAMVGSISYNDSISGKNNFATALKQPGSSFKPFVYATLFGPGHSYNPGTVLYDLQTDFGGGYVPNNFNGRFNGPIAIRDALARSLNIPAVKALALSGIKESIQTASNLGISTLTQDPSHYGLSLVLGTGEVKLVDMAAAYSGFANGGMVYKVRPILKVVDSTGKTIIDHTSDQPTKALEPEVAWQISSILSDNNARIPTFGSKNNLTVAGHTVAVKTGTTQNFKDGWTVGYTPSLAIGVWMGNDQPNQTMTQDGEIAAGPIWNKFMSEQLQGKPDEPFVRPESMQQVTLDRLSGKLPSDQSPSDQRITEWLAPWQIPKDKDDVHVTAKIDKITGKLATDLTPAEDVVIQTYFTVHSEMPNNPNWENPVQGWAQANGGSTKPPTAQDDLHTSDNLPTITFVTPQNNSSVGGTIPITVNISSSRSISRVEFFIDNQSIGSVTQSPWSTTYNMDTLSAGTHIIQVIAANDIQQTRAEQVTISTAKDTVAPGIPTNINGTNGRKPITGNPVPIHLTWVNPSDSDLVVAKIYQSTNNNPNDLGSFVKQVSATPNAAGAADIDVSPLQIGGQYWYTIRLVDTSGNENQTIRRSPMLTITP